MSHIVQIQTEVRDPAAVEAACRRLGLAPPQTGTAALYSSTVTGLQVQLPQWRYPVVFDTARGQVQFDNFNGHWGDQAQLNKLLQAYAVEKARIEARRQGHTLTEQTLSDGSIQLTIQVGGAA